jgi:hypothetical protein
VIAEKSVKVVGLIPQDVQLNTVYGAAVLSANGAPDPAIAFVKFLSDPSNARHWKDDGFEPGAGDSAQSRAALSARFFAEGLGHAQNQPLAETGNKRNDQDNVATPCDR